MRFTRNHPIRESLPIVLTPELLRRSPNKRVLDLLETNWIVCSTDGPYPLDTIASEVSRGSRGEFDIFGDDYSAAGNYPYPDPAVGGGQQAKDAYTEQFRHNLRQRGLSDSEIELLRYHNQPASALLVDFFAHGVKGQAYPSNSQHQDSQHRMFRGGDGNLYYEYTLSNLELSIGRDDDQLILVPRTIPGTVKVVYQYTPKGPELVYVAVSNSVLRDIIMSDNAVEFTDQLLEEVRQEGRCYQFSMQMNQQQFERMRVNGFERTTSRHVEHAETFKTKVNKLELIGQIHRKLWSLTGVSFSDLPLRQPQNETEKNELIGKVDAHITTFIREKISQDYVARYGEDVIRDWIWAHVADMDDFSTTFRINQSLISEHNLVFENTMHRVNYTEAQGLFIEGEVPMRLKPRLDDDDTHSDKGKVRVKVFITPTFGDNPLGAEYKGTVISNANVAEASESHLLMGLQAAGFDTDLTSPNVRLIESIIAPCKPSSSSPKVSIS